MLRWSTKNPIRSSLSSLPLLRVDDRRVVHHTYGSYTPCGSVLSPSEVLRSLGRAVIGRTRRCSSPCRGSRCFAGMRHERCRSLETAGRTSRHAAWIGGLVARRQRVVDARRPPNCLPGKASEAHVAWRLSIDSSHEHACLLRSGSFDHGILPSYAGPMGSVKSRKYTLDPRRCNPTLRRCDRRACSAADRTSGTGEPPRSARRPKGAQVTGKRDRGCI